jgi:group I intron endonuclease
MNSGIYKIINTVNGKYYVGSSVDCKDRWREHKRGLKANRHSNSYLQASWNKYGEKAFEFKIVDAVPKEQLLDREQFYLDFMALEKGWMYNLNPFATKGPDTSDHTIYSFINRNTKETCVSTQLEFRKKYNIDSKRMPFIVCPKIRKNGSYTPQYRGWMTVVEYEKWKIEQALSVDLRLLKEVIDDERNRLLAEQRINALAARRLYVSTHQDEIIKQRNAKSLQYYYAHHEERKASDRQRGRERYAGMTDEEKKQSQQKTKVWRDNNKERVSEHNRKYRKEHA